MPRIERDDARGDARQHRLDEGAAGVELGVGGAERARLLLEPPGHPVEGGRERLDLVLALRDRHPSREIARLDPPGGVDKLARRAGQGGPRSSSAVTIDKPDDNQRAEQKRRIETQLVDLGLVRAARGNRRNTSFARCDLAGNSGSKTRAAYK